MAHQLRPVGPGFQGSSTSILGGVDNDHSNSIAGFDLRFRAPWLGNTEFYGEYSGEDNAGGVWPIVESYVAGVGRTNQLLRFEL